MKKFWILGFFLVFVSGCATTRGYEQMLDSWVGASDRDLIAMWGAPDSVYEFDATQKVVTYHHGGSIYNPGMEPMYYSTRVGNTITTTPVGGVPPQITNYSCKTDFTITNGVVTKWRWEGNSCRAVPNKPKTTDENSNVSNAAAPTAAPSKK